MSSVNWTQNLRYILFIYIHIHRPSAKFPVSIFYFSSKAVLKHSTMSNFVQTAPSAQLVTSFLSLDPFRHPWKACVARKKWKLIKKYQDFCLITSLPPSTVGWFITSTLLSHTKSVRETRCVWICWISYYRRGGNKSPKAERSVRGFLGRAGQMSESRTALGRATEELDPMEGNLMRTKLKSYVCGEMGKTSGKHRRG